MTKNGKTIGCICIAAGVLVLLLLVPCWIWLGLAGIALLVAGILLLRRRC